MTAWLARWRAATATLTWVNCGHPPAYLLNTAGSLQELEGRVHAPLGTVQKRTRFELTSRQLRSRERLVLVTDGIVDRRVEGGGTFGFDGIRRAVEQTASETAASTAMAIQQAVTECWRKPLEDDATIVVMAIH